MLQRAMVKKKKKKHATDDNADCRLEDCKEKKKRAEMLGQPQAHTHEKAAVAFENAVNR